MKHGSRREGTERESRRRKQRGEGRSLFCLSWIVLHNSTHSCARNAHSGTIRRESHEREEESCEWYASINRLQCRKIKRKEGNNAIPRDNPNISNNNQTMALKEEKKGNNTHTNTTIQISTSVKERIRGREGRKSHSGKSEEGGRGEEHKGPLHLIVVNC